jgi:8-hydroxy-5-deazaflavin:NADPH oxidoreductase
MRVGIIGGTGGMGKGFALRWCYSHDIIVGSRDAQRAKEAVQSYIEVAREAYGNSMTGSILSIPYESIDDTCDRLVKEVRNECVIVSPIVPMTRIDAGFIYIPIEKGKKFAAEMVADKLPPRSRVVSAFHTISEVKLLNVKRSLDADTFVCGDDQSTVATLNTLISEINGLRSIYLGPLSMTYQAEILTPMLLNAAKRNKMKHPSIRLV